MKIRSLGVLLLFLTPALMAGPSVVRAPPPIAPLGVVGLRITVQDFDYGAPWNKKPERIVVGNALVVEGRLLLTTSDMVKNATLIQARKMGRYPDYPARLALVDYEVDLALLEVDEEEFWEGLTPLPLSEKPLSSGRFVINRWRPNGRFERGSGEVVELRVSTTRYGNIEIPELRASTAMNGLGWAEVLTLEEKVVGLITSHNDNGLDAINSPLLSLFIKAARQKPYRGFAHRGFSWQRLNHPDLKRAHGQDEDSPGVLIRHVLAGGTGSEVLLPGDILLRIGEHEIDPEGYIRHPLYGPVQFTIAINETLDETLPVRILREGKEISLELGRRLFADEDYRIRPQTFGKPIDFEVFGGLVIQELSVNYLRLWGKNWRRKAPTRLAIEYSLNRIRKKGGQPEKVLIISKVLPDPVNLGYDDIENTILLKANGKPLASLEDFRQAVGSQVDGFHILELMAGQNRSTVVFNAGEMKEANARVRELYGVKKLPEPAGATEENREIRGKKRDN